MDLASPTVEDDIDRAIRRYGADAVKAAVKELTKPKRGRSKIPDMKRLADAIKRDAREWLEGGDPLAARSNYSIAKEYADANPGHSHPATMMRIQRKLGKKPHDRQWFMLVTAMGMSRDSGPYGAHIRALEALVMLDSGSAWSDMLEHHRRDIDRYRENKGSLSDSLTMREIEEGARYAPAAFGGLDLGPGGLGGLLANSLLNARGGAGKR